MRDSSSDSTSHEQPVAPSLETLTVTSEAKTLCLDSDDSSMFFLSQAEELSQLGCFEWEIATNKVRWSDGLFRIYGLQPQQFPATLEGFMERVVPEDRQHVMQSIQEAIASRGSFLCFEKITHVSGEIRQLESRGKVFVDENGEPKALVGVCRDVTQRTENQRAQELQIKGLKLLAESASLIMVNRDEQQWQDLFLELASHLNCDCYANCDLVDGKLKLVSIVGLADEDVEYYRELELGQGMCGTCAMSRKFLYTPAEVLEHHSQGARLWARGFRMCVVVPLIADECLLGTLTFASRNRSSMHQWELDFVQTVGQLVAAAKAQRYFESQLRESELRFRSLAENTADALIVHDLHGVILDVNRATCDALMFSRKELLGSDMREIVAHLPAEYSSGYQSLVGKTPKLLEGRFRRKDATQFTVEILANIIDYHGQQAVLAAVRDTTERVAAERQKRRADETRRLILEQASMITWEANPDSLEFEFLNGPCDGILGDPIEVWRTPGFWVERTHPSDLQDVRDKLALVNHQRQRCEFRMRHAQGHYVWVELFVEAQHEESCVSLLSGVMSDISARKALEERLRHSQKMEAIGRLAGGVAHDFNNLLTVISTSAELILMRAQHDRDNLEAIKAIQDTVDRAQGLTSQLLMFGRKSAHRRTCLDLNQVVLSAERLLRRLIGEDITLTTRLATSLPPVLVDPSHVDQVIVNLAVNARDAMPKGGLFHLETSVRTISESDIGRDDLKPGDYVELTVTDTGCGMKDEVCAKIFEPFFTTKQVGRGSGLGLSVAYGVIREAGGSISVNSTVGEGTTFRILLPATQVTSVVVSPELIQLPFHGTESVLLVEDEPSVRRAAAAALNMFGYKVLEACSGIEGQEIANACRGDFDLLLTDLVMPGISGIDLANQVIRDYPNVRVLCLSGYSESILRDEQIQFPFLAKPFTVQQLLSKVREVLDASREAVLNIA